MDRTERMNEIEDKLWLLVPNQRKREKLVDQIMGICEDRE